MNDALEAMARRAVSAGGFMGTVTAVDVATGTVSLNVGTGEVVTGVYVLSDFTVPEVGQYMIVLKVGTFYVAWPRMTRSPVRAGRVALVNASAATVNVDLGGGVIASGLPYLSSYSPQLLDVVFLGAWESSYVVLGKSATATVTPPTPTPEFPTVTYGTETFLWSDGWAGDKNRTSGAWSWVTQQGGYVGIEKEFLGTDIHEFQTLARFDLSSMPSGVSVTSIKLVLSVGSGVLNQDFKVKTLIRPHNYTSPPSGTPSWDSRTITQTLEGTGVLVENRNYTITIPSAWFTDLLAGTIKGIGFAPQNSADGWGKIWVSPRLEVSWKKTS